jgi:hypothetical protein
VVHRAALRAAERRVARNRRVAARGLVAIGGSRGGVFVPWLLAAIAGAPAAADAVLDGIRNAPQLV